MSKNKDIIDNVIMLSDLVLKNLQLPSTGIIYKLSMGIELKTHQENEIFESIIENLVKRQEISKKYSKKQITNFLWNYLLNIIEKPEQYFSNRHEKALGFVRSLNAPPKEWMVLIPIDGLTSEITKFRIGEVQFDIFNRSEIKEWKILELDDDKLKKRYETYQKSEVVKVVDGIRSIIPKLDFETYKKEETEHHEKILDNFVNKICAKIIVEVVDAEKAIEVGKYRLDSSLSLIRMFYGIVRSKPRIRIEEPMSIVAESLDHKGVLKTHLRWSINDRIELAEQEKLMKFFKIFETVLCKPKTRLDMSIVRSIRWCGKAINETSFEEKFVDYFTALECVLSKKDEGLKGGIIAKRVAILLSESVDNSEQLGKDVLDLYEIRSDIVHGSKYEIQNKDIYAMDIITRRIIPIVTEVVQKNGFTRIEQLLNWIDCQPK